MPCAIHRAMTAADEAWRASLRSVTIADLAAQVTGEHGRGVLDGVRNWFNAAPWEKAAPSRTEGAVRGV